MPLLHPRPLARRLLASALTLGALGLAACDNTTGAEIYRHTMTIGANGNASHDLPGEVGTPSELPALDCFVADPQDLVWFQVSSVEIPRDPPPNEVLSNCILEPSPLDPNRLTATVEGETPGWLVQFVVTFED